VSDAFLICRRCGVLHPLLATPADEDATDLADFRATHEAHGLERARRVPDSALFDGPAWDPMSARWMKVTAGSDVFVVRSWRRSANEPRHHEVSPRAPAVTDCVDMDERLLRDALDRHVYPQSLRPSKVERFVGAVRELLADLDPAEVEPSFDDVTVANATLGDLPEETCQELLSHCTSIFDDWELERVRGFIAEHRYADGALAVRVRRVLSRTAA
jgi:hypothetical protein